MFFLKAGAHFSLKVATKVSFRGKEKLWQSRFLDYFSKTKTEEFNQKKFEVSVIYLASLYVDQLNIIQKWVHTFHKK